MKHTVVICLTALVLALLGGSLVQQEINLQTEVAKSTFLKEHAYYDLEQSKFKFEMLKFTVLLKQAIGSEPDASPSPEPAIPATHASPTPPSPPNLRADNS